MAAPGSTKVSDEDRIQGLFVGLRTSGHMVRRMITRIHANRRSHLARIVERILSAIRESGMFLVAFFFSFAFNRYLAMFIRNRVQSVLVSGSGSGK